jgi:hypothetical protein
VQVWLCIAAIKAGRMGGGSDCRGLAVTSLSASLWHMCVPAALPVPLTVAAAVRHVTVNRDADGLC